MPKAVFIVLFFVFICHLSHPKIYKKCELAKYLKGKVPAEEIPIFVCIADKQGDFNTSDYVPGLYGMFTLRDHACGEDGKKGGTCNATCKSFYDDDISNDVKCAKFIKDANRDGFRYWITYLAGICSFEAASRYIDDC